jgi:hypothetical protein
MLRRHNEPTIFKTGVFGKQHILELPRQEKERLRLLEERKQFELEKQNALKKIQEEKLKLEMELKLKEKEEKAKVLIPSSKIGLGKIHKAELKPSQVQQKIKQQEKDIQEAEELQEYLDRKPPKPTEKLLNKLVKKYNKPKVSSKIKKRAKQIEELEQKVETGDKIRDMITSMF